MSALQKLDEYRYIVPKGFRDGMRIEGLIFANAELIRAIETISRSCRLPTRDAAGLVGRSLAMPDAHSRVRDSAHRRCCGSDLRTGVVSAGGVGFGYQLRRAASSVDFEAQRTAAKTRSSAQPDVPGHPVRHWQEGPYCRLSFEELDRVLEQGARWAVEHGYGTEEDLGLTSRRTAASGRPIPGSQPPCKGARPGSTWHHRPQEITLQEIQYVTTSMSLKQREHSDSSRIRSSYWIQPGFERTRASVCTD